MHAPTHGRRPGQAERTARPSAGPGGGGGVLRARGSLVIKLLEGGDTRALAARLRAHFARVAWVTPAATRRHSREVFLVCVGRRRPGPAAGRAAGAA